jgi:hypothetical protein
MISGDEYDALTKGGRTVHRIKIGARAAIKHRFRRRERKQGRKEANLCLAA